MLNLVWAIFYALRNPNILVLMMGKIDLNQGPLLVAYRQFVYYSLLERLKNKIPKLSITEKKWLVFQLLCAVSQVHRGGLVHGDIKPENILITSYNQLFLTDLVKYKPTYVEADLVNYNLYFGEMDNNRRCYIAPERFRQQSSQ